MSGHYLERYAFQNQYIQKERYGNPDIIIVLPCHNEEELLVSLESIDDCEEIEGAVAIIVAINASESADKRIIDQNIKTFQDCQNWIKSDNRKFNYHFILENRLPKKHAGVGLARKLGMDEGIRIFESNNKNGILVCFDADSLCKPNLLIEIDKLFRGDLKITACAIHFEHPLEGKLVQSIYEGIANYELHLRYYIDALKHTNFPYAYQTIGSSMAVRSSIYQKQGGMNRRKAGEDFYFLHKIIPLGNFKNLNSTMIIPSPRRSDRVPFGTGRAIGTWLDEGNENLMSYAPQVFEDLKVFFISVQTLYCLPESDIRLLWNEFPESLKEFVSVDEFIARISEFNNHSASDIIFNRRFFQWFDGFRILKFVHFARDKYYPNVPISEGTKWLFDVIGLQSDKEDVNEQLLILREWDRKQ